MAKMDLLRFATAGSVDDGKSSSTTCAGATASSTSRA